MNAQQRRAYRRARPKLGELVEFWGPRGEKEIGVIRRYPCLRECSITAPYGDYAYVPVRLITRVFP